MQEVKIYTASPSDLSPPVQSESFCVDMVLVSDYAALELRCAALAAENEGLKGGIKQAFEDMEAHHDDDGLFSYDADGEPMDALLRLCDAQGSITSLMNYETPATDVFLAEVRAQAHKEGAHFVANRMLAAWDAGFIDDTAKNAADIARMILTSTEFMAEAPEGDFDRSFADGVLKNIAAQLRKGVQS
ncbi:ead/Ea22-like family protein [Salmonella enterica]|nr:ead/Ea22-like family protein [Salmonella enterica]EBQ4289092.1 ead/Ea22-like family protein [Salmonella enterica]EBQ4483046.1 ead/Ea22-like family protein [Salmonella enterica]EBQ4500762.1 ead/Ea22-like family protein [Salmonella enterica]ECC2506911.1 ead/Ea22-like family protein [Salmonella enterica]